MGTQISGKEQSNQKFPKTQKKFSFFALSIWLCLCAFIIFTTAGIIGLLPENLQKTVSGDHEPLLALSAEQVAEDSAMTATTATNTSTVISTVKATSVPAVTSAPTVQTVSTVQAAAQLPKVTGAALNRPAPKNGDEDLPTRIIIPTVGIDAPVLNPQSEDLAVLDSSLLKGAVRHPQSASLNQDGPVFIFGHSSTLTVTHNPAYRTFSNLGHLKQGDEIRVQGNGRVYVYTVTMVSVYKESQARVDLSDPARRLVLATCNIFGKKEERIMVTADFSFSFENK